MHANAFRYKQIQINSIFRSVVIRYGYLDSWVGKCVCSIPISNLKKIYSFDMFHMIIYFILSFTISVYVPRCTILDMNWTHNTYHTHKHTCIE